MLSPSLMRCFDNQKESVFALRARLRHGVCQYISLSAAVALRSYCFGCVTHIGAIELTVSKHQISAIELSKHNVKEGGKIVIHADNANENII